MSSEIPPRESAVEAVREFFKKLEAEDRWDLPPTDGVGPAGDEFVERAAALLEDYARGWAKELNLAWDRRGEDRGVPPVPVLQPAYDKLIEELVGYRRAVENGGPDVPAGLLAIAVAELRKRLARLEDSECQLCGARFPDAELVEDRRDWGPGEPSSQCHPCVENQSLRERLAARERDLEDAAGDLPVEIPEPGTPLARVLAANALLRRQVADLVANKEDA